MPISNSTELRIPCQNCRRINKYTSPIYSETISPIIIKRLAENRYHFQGVCIICQKIKSKYLNQAQRKILPKEILEMPIGKSSDDIKIGGLEPFTMSLITAGIALLPKLIENAPKIIDSIKGLFNKKEGGELENDELTLNQAIKIIQGKGLDIYFK